MPISDEIDTCPTRMLDTGLGGSAPAARSRAPAIASLTGIRGVAAVWVMLTHYQAVMAAYLHDPAILDNSFLYNGFRGVDLFFVLSGFILMHVHQNDFRVLASQSVRRFYLLRFFRVYPLNTVVLLALVPLALGLPEIVDWFRFDHGAPIPYHDQDFSAAGFVQSFLLAQSWTVAKLGEWNGPAWSLSAEVFAYAFFPVLAWTLVRIGSALMCTAAAALSLVALVGLLMLGHHMHDSPTGTFGLIRCVFGFTAGSCMARAFQLRPASNAAASWLGAPLAWVSVGVIAATLSDPRFNMFIVFGFCGLIYALAFQRGLIDTVLSSGPAMFLGRISFSLYMIHYVPLKLSLWASQTYLDTASFAERVACLIAIPFICIALALIAYHAVELPFQRYARSIVRRERDTHLHSALAA